MGWEIEGTDEFRDWFLGLTVAEDMAVSAAIDYLVERGPGLGRPFVDTVSRSRLPNMKELRVKRNDIRILFAFDPRRTAILLLGGSKTDDWRGWYDRNIPVAERLYDEYLAEVRKERLR